MVAMWLTQHQSERLGLLSRSCRVSVMSAGSWFGLCSVLSSVRIEQCDLVTALAMLKIRSNGSLVHSAGVLADAALANQIQAGLQRVWGPKAMVAWRLTTPRDLSGCMLFSSVSALLGGPGQGHILWVLGADVLEGMQLGCLLSEPRSRPLPYQLR